jgi:hypothetical protein
VSSEPLLAPTSIGDLLDRISILTIKAERIGEPAKAANIARELAALTDLRDAAGLDTPQLAGLLSDLDEVNRMLWDVEEEIRTLDRKGDFGSRFIALARTVYARNDRRSAIKREINRASGSAITEEKSY